MSKQQISITRASAHNLKGVSCVIPHGVLCCLTGVSGSGKSSLAFDTLFVEGQRRYVQSLSHQAKRIIGNLPKPDVESISGLTPTIAIEQKTSGGSPRSTIGTLTEIHDYLRVLYARISIPYCPLSGEPLVAISQQEILDGIFARYTGRNLIILSPLIKNKKGELKEDLQHLEHKGYSRVRLDGVISRISDIEAVEPTSAHDLDVVVDRLKIHDENRHRIIESTKTALDVGKGLLLLVDAERGEEELLSEHAYSKASGKSYPPLEPNDFSFNSPTGMCPACQGLGFTWTGNDRAAKSKHHIRQMEEMRGISVCHTCSGSRLKSYPAAARLRGLTIHKLSLKTVDEALFFFRDFTLPPQLAFAEESVAQVKSRLSFLHSVGLGYLTLDRQTATLSGGEFQRARLASQMGSSLVGITYILDEPSIGLHPHDNARLIESLQELKRRTPSSSSNMMSR
jgi:excinuclease ABC subunit A